MMKARRDEADAAARATAFRSTEDFDRAHLHSEFAAQMQSRRALYASARNLRLRDQPKQAMRALDALVQVHPGFSLLFEERGHCLLALGESGRAIESFERAVAINPALGASWAMLERLLRAAGEPQRAAIATQHLAKLNELPPTIVEAGSLFCDGEHAAAENLLTASIETDGRHVEALRLLARLAQRRGATARAESLFREVVENAPAYAAARLDLVRILIERQTYAAALEQVELWLHAAPSDPEARFLRATILAGLGRHEAAVPIFRELLAEMPQRNHLRIVLGHSLKALGRAEEAVRAYQDATGGHDDIGDAYWSLANLKTYRFSDSEIARMRELEARPAPAQPDRPQLCFALGKALEDRADFAASWDFYARGNALMRARSSYRAEQISDRARRLIETCSAEFFASRRGAGATDRDPIFIIGLPRSGSTLLEQILASHPDVDGTQELHEIPRLVSDWRGRYPELLADLEPAQFEHLGRRYLDDTRVHRRGRPRFIDKMPNNFWHVGLIHLMLPNATIIDIRREPMACCVSNLKQLFARGQEFCYGIEEIARYYRIYLELMRHWNRVLPGRVLKVAYEDLVDDLDGSVRRILNHCGLAFDPACLDFHRSRRAINTPSSEQVRRPLFREGLSQWRQFEPWLDPLRNELGDALERYRK